jgi:assimilatory nitrate reductase catalytic subunit
MSAPKAVKTTCPYCGVGCGVTATRYGDGSVRVEGDAKHPANFGRLCSKGSALGDTLGDHDRLLYPEIDGKRVSWDAALGAVAEGLADIRETYGPDSIAFYLSGQLLTEDYYVANKLMKGFLGSANVDTNSRLCMASSVAGHKRAFGSDTVPGNYQDLDEADLIVLVGSNTAWCHPILFQRMMTAKRTRGAKIVSIDPRGTASSEESDLHLGLAPGTDAILFNGLLAYLAAHGALDRPFIARHCSGYEATIEAARADAVSIAEVARRTHLDARDIERFYGWFCTTERTVTCYSQGINQSSSGTDKVNAIINCHLATGRIGRRGMGPLSLTGQPNAMGGREVGGLANQLAAHMGFDPLSVERVKRFWAGPDMARHEGLKAVDMFDAIAEGRVRAVWIMATNPVASMPNAQAVIAALEKCELVIVSDCFANADTLRYADIRLPAAGWGEKDGTVTNSERRISRQRPFLPLPGEAKPDWWIVTETARRLGFADSFAYETPADIFREHAALSAFENDGLRAFDIGAFAEIDENAYDSLAPVQWPLRKGESEGMARLFGAGGFFTPDRRANFVPVSAREPYVSAGSFYPLTLNTGRVRDQWHTMTRTGRSATLSQHTSEPVVKLNPLDARRFGIEDGGFASVRTPWGSADFKAEVSEDQRIGSVFVPMHWNAENASCGGIAALVNPTCDPISGQPALKHTPATLRPKFYGYRGVCLSRTRLDLPDGIHWSVTRQDHCYAYAIATDGPPNGNWPLWVRSILKCEPDQLVAMVDVRSGVFRYAAINNDRVDACLFLDRGKECLSLHWVKELFASETLDRLPRRMLMAGRTVDGMADPGRIVCACYAVGINSLMSAISAQALTTVEQIGASLKAGTNCGSCQPELREILRRTNPPELVEA